MALVKARKVHTCDSCKKETIRIGDIYEYESFREPRFNDRDEQVGIEYVKICICKNCLDNGCSWEQ